MSIPIPDQESSSCVCRRDQTRTEHRSVRHAVDQEAAAHLGISKAHLSNLINGRSREFQLSFARVGRRILIKREWADEWLENAAEQTFANANI